jgi:hypothetical protein
MIADHESHYVADLGVLHVIEWSPGCCNHSICSITVYVEFCSPCIHTKILLDEGMKLVMLIVPIFGLSGCYIIQSLNYLEVSQRGTCDHLRKVPEYQAELNCSRNFSDGVARRSVDASRDGCTLNSKYKYCTETVMRCFLICHTV